MIHRRTAALALLVAALSAAASLLGPAPRGVASGEPAAAHPPLLAYYYIWFDESSWDRAKTDYPLLGRYSSDDRAVMEKHIQWAKEAGIDGFLVSWKHTERLDRRLAQLIDVAEAEDFKLGIVYEGLDFERHPLPAATVAADLDVFLDRYAGRDAFKMYERPLVIWSGTWRFSTEDIESVAGPRRDRLMLLATEKNVEGFQRVEHTVDGDAYYWSSVNPDTYPDYPGKLASVGAAVHAAGGTWIAPAAPGFDAKMVGGTSVVARNDGQTLRREMAAALESAPDAVGLISWNEFSENTYVEPSSKYGARYLQFVKEAHDGAAPATRISAGTDGLDSSSPGGRWVTYQLPLLGALVLAGIFSLAVVVRRSISTRRLRSVYPVPQGITRGDGE